MRADLRHKTASVTLESLGLPTGPALVLRSCCTCPSPGTLLFLCPLQPKAVSPLACWGQAEKGSWSCVGWRRTRPGLQAAHFSVSGLGGEGTGKQPSPGRPCVRISLQRTSKRNFPGGWGQWSPGLCQELGTAPSQPQESSGQLPPHLHSKVQLAHRHPASRTGRQGRSRGRAGGRESRPGPGARGGHGSALPRPRSLRG